MLVTFVTVVHVIVCVFLILVILLQAGKDAGMGSALGGGGSGSVFGGRGAGSFLGKVTAVAASIFFITSLSLSFAASYRPSVTDAFEAPAPAPQLPPTQGQATPPAAPAPAQPAPAPEQAAPAAPAPAAPAAPAEQPPANNQ